MNDTDKLVLITGGNRGLGYAAATKLVQRGFRVVLTSRSAARAEEAVAQIRTAVPGANVRGMSLDLSSLAEVRAFVQRFTAEEQALHVLIANAANLPSDKLPQYTVDGFEATFATNHLGHFLLTTQLVPLLAAGAQQAGEARVVVVSSRLHLPGSMGPDVRFDFDDVNLRRDYHPMVAYKNSKLANLWFTYELNRRLHDQHITVNALCPGFVPETAVSEARSVRRLMFKYVLPRLPFARRLDQATDTYMYVATDPALRGVGGKFYAEQRPISSSPESYDGNKAAHLWQLSEELTALRSDEPVTQSA